MISVTALQQNSKTIYVGLLSTLTVFLLMDYIPVLASFSQWVTPPVSLFLGLIFALVCGQAYPKFNKKVSKYCMAPIISTQPSWFYVMMVVTVLLFTEMKHTFTELVQRMQNDEMITLAKFLAISGIILPMLPKEPLIPGINLTPYTIWLATVVVSGISYLSYLLKQYVFRESGTLVSGIIGGLYSSTATISILARKCKRIQTHEIPEYVSAMMLAISMMFLRFMILILIFSTSIFLDIYPICSSCL